MKTLTKEMQNAITPAMALKLLKQGNKRFVNNLKLNRNLLQQVKKAHFEVLFAQSPVERMSEYAKEINAGLIVVVTRNKRGFSGFFLSSFADRILKLSPCDLSVLRPK